MSNVPHSTFCNNPQHLTQTDDHVQILLTSASTAANSHDAMRYSQAAVNAAHALSIVNQSKLQQTSDPA